MCTGKSKNQVHVKMYLFRIFNQKMLESLNMLHKLVQIHPRLYYNICGFKGHCSDLL